MAWQRYFSSHLVLRYAVLALAVACDSNDRITTAPISPPSEAARTIAPSPIRTVERPAIPRADIQLAARGALRPGEPIGIDAVVRGNRESPHVEVELTILDEGESSTLTAGAVTRPLTRWVIALGQNGMHQSSRSITFARPGYYRVLATVHAERPPEAVVRNRAEEYVSGDTLIIDDVSKSLWLAIDEQGGRSTDGYDPTVADSTKQPRFGAYGPFVSRPPRKSARSRPYRAGGAVGAVTASGLTPGGFGGHLYYHEQDRSGSPLAPVSNAAFAVACYDPDGLLSMYVGVTTDANGYFEGSCFDDSSGWSVYDNLQSAHVVVYGNSTSTAVVSLPWGAPGTTQDLVVTNDQAARAFLRLYESIPVAFSKFAATRTTLNAFASNNNNTTSSNYSPTNDDIHYGQNAVFYDYGEFTLIHEYGHAFQFGAIEAPAAYTCSGSGHSPGSPNTAPCAFAEGFADFFSAWIDNARQGSYAYSDYGFERTDWGTADGKFDEGRVAGFLYDVVDDGTELDGVSNTVVGDDDSMHLAASWLAQLMRNCSLRDLSTTTTKLSSIDQLVYCMEGDMSALSDPTQPGSWTYYSSVTPNTATPAGWDKNKLRALWHYNLYSVGLLP